MEIVDGSGGSLELELRGGLQDVVRRNKGAELVTAFRVLRRPGKEELTLADRSGPPCSRKERRTRNKKRGGQSTPLEAGRKECEGGFGRSGRSTHTENGRVNRRSPEAQRTKERVFGVAQVSPQEGWWKTG